MARRRILPGVDIVYDGDDISFQCDGEVIEDMEFTWEEFEDPVLLGEVAEELAEYVDEENSTVDNPVAAIKRQLKKMLHDQSEVDEEEAEGDEDDEDFELDIDEDEEYDE